MSIITFVVFCFAVYFNLRKNTICRYIRLEIKKNIMFSSISGFDNLPLFRFRYRTGFTYDAGVVVGRFCFRCGRLAITDRKQEHHKYRI